MKRCLVLGGSGVVGSAVCQALSVAGAKVAFTFLRDATAADRLAPAIAIRADLADPAAVEAAVDRAAEALGGVDVLVHAAGAEAREDPDLAAWDLAMAVNARAPFLAVRRLLPIFAAAGGGEVVLVASVDVAKPIAVPAHHAASKGALRGLGVALAKELGPRNVRVNLVAPGLLDAGASRDVREDLRREYLAHSGAKRFGRPAEIAAIVRFLALENTYVTGQTLVADGGL